MVSADTVDPGGEFHPLDPDRILDTRPEQGEYDVAPLGVKTAGKATATGGTEGEFVFDPLGRGGLPTDAADVLAVVMTITITEPSHDGYLSVYPTGYEFGGGGGEDISALLTFGKGDNVPNLAIVGLGDGGTMTFNSNMTEQGTYHVVVDVFGWISTSNYGVGGSRLELVDPGRILDTRSLPNPRGSGVSLQAGDTMVLPIRGVDAVSPAQPDIVPDDPAVTAVLVNIALVNQNPTSADTFVSITPRPLTPGSPRTANSLVKPGGIHANTTIIPVDPLTGNVAIYNNLGELDIVIDMLGYFKSGVPAATNRGRVVPLEAPFRSFDTRKPEFGDTPLGHGSSEQWSFKNFAASVTLNPGQTNEQKNPPQQGLIGDLFAVDLQKLYPTDGNQPSYLQLYPGGLATRPLSANINFFPGEVVPNMALVRYGTNGAGDDYVIEAYNDYGSVDYVLDVYAIVLDD
ncbi:MAG: hypothetical protein HKN44_06605 [Ilumatobacter sp.]|nr:hypothetical protein [Ilumatobacter sp.]